MAQTLKKTLFALLLVASFLPLQTANADTGPKPSMDFTFVQGFSGQTVTIVSGVLLECEQADCQDAIPLPELGPQRFSCQTNSCSAMAYGFKPYHRLQIQFSDGVTRESNVFKTAQFQSSYNVTIRQADLLVKSKFTLNLFSIWTYILVCGLCLVGVILLVVVIILLVRRSKKK